MSNDIGIRMFAAIEIQKFEFLFNIVVFVNLVQHNVLIFDLFLIDIVIYFIILVSL